jgi:hypothetical protein
MMTYFVRQREPVLSGGSYNENDIDGDDDNGGNDGDNVGRNRCSIAARSRSPSVADRVSSNDLR